MNRISTTIKVKWRTKTKPPSTTKKSTTARYRRMRLPYFLLLASAALLAGSVGPSAAFQKAGKTFVSTPSRGAALAALPFPSTDAASNRSLLSRLGPLRSPKHCKSAPRRAKDDGARKISNKQLLALVTTSCLAAIARPSAARAAAAPAPAVARLARGHEADRRRREAGHRRRRPRAAQVTDRWEQGAAECARGPAEYARRRAELHV